MDQKFTREGVVGRINGHDVFAQCNDDASVWRVRIRGKWSAVQTSCDAQTQIMVGKDIYLIQASREGFSVTFFNKRH